MTGSRDTGIFARQMEIVLDRHLAKIGARSKVIERTARASIAVNKALASAAAGNLNGLLRAAAAVVRLGPAGIHRYLRDSRIVDVWRRASARN